MKRGWRQIELFRDLARETFGSFANRYAEDDAVKRLIRVFETVGTAERAIDLVRALKPDYAFGEGLLDRLTRLMAKLEEEGRYTDSNTCWLALEALGANDPFARFNRALSEYKAANDASTHL
jgi:hypothetical protein